MYSDNEVISKKLYGITEKMIERTNEEITKKPIIEMFELKKFENIVKSRQSEINKIKLLFNEENISNNNKIIKNMKNKNSYRALYLKIKNLKTPYEYNYLNESYLNIIKRKNYRKIKKKLYSWNNSYSNLLTFYQK